MKVTPDESATGWSDGLFAIVVMPSRSISASGRIGSGRAMSVRSG